MFIKKAHNFYSRHRKGILLLLGASILLAPLFIALITTRFNFKGDLEGLYLLKGDKGYIYELKDDIYLGEYERLLFKIEFGTLFTSPEYRKGQDPAGPLLKYMWDKNEGDGYIMTHYPDGTKFVTAFGRFIDSEGEAPKGLFVGGGLPSYEYEHAEVTMNETGMAYFNGAEWRHLWCNANETIVSAFSLSDMQYPSSWRFLGSRVLLDYNNELILQSSHSVGIDGVPLRIDRFAIYKAANKYIILVIKIKNTGQKAAAYYYVYGDEPWLGNFGTSLGNVGWTKDRLYNYEARINTDKYSFAGMYDYGNKAIPSGQMTYSGTANFIEWLGNVKPDLAYFSNQTGTFTDESKKAPLASENNRVIFLEWGPRLLQPGQSDVIALAIGMADNDPKTGFPVKPAVNINPDFLQYILDKE